VPRLAELPSVRLQQQPGSTVGEDLST